jgi:5'-nucleotidase
VHLKDGATEITSGTLDGSGHVTLTVPAKTYAVGQVTLTAVYDGDATHDGSTDPLTLTTTKAASSLTVPNATVQFGRAAPVTVTVNTPAGVSATGTVTVKNGATTLGTGTVSGGSATITIPAGSVPVGTATLTASYSGDSNVSGSDKTFSLTVTKATSTTEATVKPKNPTKNTKVKLIVKVEGSDGVEITGQVKIKVGGDTITKTLEDGKLKLNLGKFAKGKHKVKVIYLGSATVEGSTDTVKFTVS